MSVRRLTPLLQLVSLIALMAAPALQACPITNQASEPEPPVIISYGWSSPDTRYLKLHTAELELRPFTGVSTYVSWPLVEAGGVRSDGNASNNLGWQVFENSRFAPQIRKHAVQDLKQAKFDQFKHNFMYMGAYFGDDPIGPPKRRVFDWFDDARWQTICLNARDLAAVALQGGCAGILFDPEEYGCLFWIWKDVHSKDGHYAWMEVREGYGLNEFPAYQGKTFEQVRDKVRQRGREFIKAINEEFPGCVFWGLWTYSRFAAGMRWDRGDKDPLHQNGHLYVDFLDGMLEASDAETIFVDGCEDAYRAVEREDFVALRRNATEGALLYTRVGPDVYSKKTRVGFAIYMDQYPHGKCRHKWNSTDPEANVMTPDRLEKIVRRALEVGDGYVWIYGEFASWWLDSTADKFETGVLSRDDHRWISPVYWESVENAVAGWSKTTFRNEK